MYSSDPSATLLQHAHIWVFHVQGQVRAGSPSPAEDLGAKRIDVLEHLVRHPQATYQMVVKGDSMKDEGIFDGDIILVERAITLVGVNYLDRRVASRKNVTRRFVVVIRSFLSFWLFLDSLFKKPPAGAAGGAWLRPSRMVQLTLGCFVVPCPGSTANADAFRAGYFILPPDLPHTCADGPEPCPSLARRARP